MMADDQGKKDFDHRLALAEATFGTIIKNSNKYLSKIKESGKDGSLLMIDRYLNLCQNSTNALEIELNALFYGSLNNDERLLKMQSDLNSMLDKLRIEKQNLIDKGCTNSLHKFLPQTVYGPELDPMLSVSLNQNLRLK